LSTEKEDIVQAIEKLRHGIATLNRDARKKMLVAFDEVNTRFKDVFTRLFNGGEAYLQLIDAEDPLEAGLEIYAQPPGKRLQTLTLLSGGEQSLTAIALIFAMFLTQPSPICVLDEIDAALDDANVERICSLLQDFAKTYPSDALPGHHAQPDHHGQPAPFIRCDDGGKGRVQAGVGRPRTPPATAPDGNRSGITRLNN
jgi:chromosome segregation ATPase